MLDHVPGETDERSAYDAARPEAPARSHPPARDWSNVVFSVAFCEEARRAYGERAEIGGAR